VISAAVEPREVSIFIFRARSTASRAVDEVIRDAAKGALKSIYNYIDELPVLEDAVIPFLPGNSIAQPPFPAGDQQRLRFRRSSNIFRLGR
jgi:hypothetical protein